MPAMSTETRRQTRNRPSLAAEDRDLAREVGVRLKAARTRAGLTQRELAEPRYTKAYVSALENGLIKPSMAALRFLARRLGTVPEAFLADADTHWEQLEAELRLATGDWQAAADRFAEILERDPAGVGRGMCQLGLAEATKYARAIGVRVAQQRAWALAENLRSNLSSIDGVRGQLNVSDHSVVRIER